MRHAGAMLVSLLLAAAARAQVAWTREAGSGPSPRCGHALCFDSARGVTFMFGGITSTAPNYNGESWEWTGSGWTQMAVPSPSPAPRLAPAMVFDADRGVCVLFGGLLRAGGLQEQGDTWEWDGRAWTQRLAGGAPPAPRHGHAMAFDAARGVTILFGGMTLASGYNADTWEWNGQAWTQRAAVGPTPTPRRDHAMAYDAGRGVTVLFGGFTSANANGETWEWDGVAWNQRVVSGPSPRFHHAMAYDAARHVTVLSGGVTTGTVTNGETWEWDGSAWTQCMMSTSPSPRYQHALAYDPVRHVMVLFGGAIPGGYSGETWLLGTACGTADFNHDGDTGTDQDIEAFFACLAGSCCAACGTADFNGDGDTGTDQDIESFFRVLAGGNC